MHLVGSCHQLTQIYDYSMWQNYLTHSTAVARLSTGQTDWQLRQTKIGSYRLVKSKRHNKQSQDEICQRQTGNYQVG